MKIIFISGISSGIGYAAADFFLKQGHKVIGTYRKTQDADYFKKTYGEKFVGFEVDVTDFMKVDSLATQLKTAGIDRIDGLVNNAGIALAGPIEFQDFTEAQKIIQTNVLGLIKMTQVMIPFLRKSADGRIVNISSVSGVMGTPFLGMYCASKHAVEGFSEALRREMNLYAIKVSIVGPGSIKTPIWQKGFEIVATKYDHTEYKFSFHRFMKFAANEEKNGLDVSAVVHDINHAMTSSAPKIRYAPVPRLFSTRVLPTLFPKKIFDKMVCRALGLVPKM